jgi:colanic acid/amylovoran biosynthesis protein
MKVVVINAYVRENAGDAAPLSVCLRHVREAFPKADIRIAGMESPTTHPSFEDAPNIGSIRRYVADSGVSLRRRVLRKAAGLALGAAVVMAPRWLGRSLLPLLPAEIRAEATAVSEADLVVSMGGGYLNARPGLDGYQNVFFVLLPALLAQKHHRPVVFAPQSFGPFPAALQRRMVAYTLRRAALVLAREDVSVEVLTSCGLPVAQVRRAVDSGFAFAPPARPGWRDRLGVSTSTRLIGVTARRWMAPAAQQRYERALAATIDSLHERGARVILIPQVSTDYLGDDDRTVEKRIADFCTTAPLQIVERVDYRDLKGVYHECDMLIGTRFHSVIFSLTSDTPCIAIEYEHKTRGIMRDLDLERWVIPIEDVTYGRLWALVECLESHHDEYRAHLRRTLPDYLARADALPVMLREIVPSTVLPVGAAR